MPDIFDDLRKSLRNEAQQLEKRARLTNQIVGLFVKHNCTISEAKSVIELVRKDLEKSPVQLESNIKDLDGLEDE